MIAATSASSATSSSSTSAVSALLGLMNTIKIAIAGATTSASPITSAAAPVTPAATSAITSSFAPITTAAIAPAAGHQAVVTVNSVSALMLALKSAQAGDTIQLAAGTYSGLNISGMNFSGKGVTVTSQDASHPAVLAGLKLSNSSGFTFSHLEMTTVGVSDPYYGFRLQTVQNVTFSNDNIHGDPTVAPGSQISGFYIPVGSSGVTFTNTTFHDMNAAITAMTTNLIVSNNDFYHMSKGGVELAGGANINISNNNFHDFIDSAGVHSDAIQIFTVGVSAAPSNISITDNNIWRGSGDAGQGIFVQDETGSMAYSNVTITGNKVLGETWNSIWVNTAVTGTLNVSNNTVASWSGVNKEGTGDAAAMAATTFSTTSFTGEIVIRGDDSHAAITETGNTAQLFITGSSQVTPANNTQSGALAMPTDNSGVGSSVKAQAAHEVVSATHGSLSGNLLVGATGGQLYLADIGVGTGSQKVVSSTGATSFNGAYGVLTVHQDGSYTYAETKDGLLAGQTYTDHFTSTIANQNGEVTASTLDIVITGSASGDGGKDTLMGGASATTVSGFGAGSTLVGGVGKDTFQFNNISQVPVGYSTRIEQFKSGDIIDLSHIDPLLHIVNKFDGHAHELLVQVASVSAGSWLVSGDTTGHGTANFQFQVYSSGQMIADSFHL